MARSLYIEISLRLCLGLSGSCFFSAVEVATGGQDEGFKLLSRMGGIDDDYKLRGPRSRILNPQTSMRFENGSLSLFLFLFLFLFLSPSLFLCFSISLLPVSLDEAKSLIHATEKEGKVISMKRRNGC